MRLVHVAALAAHELEHLLRVGRAVDLSILRMLHLERGLRVLRTVHEPVHRLWKHDRPVAAKMHVRLFGRDQQELRIGLRLERAEVRVELVEAQIGEIGGMPVAVEVHDHRRIDAHGLQHRLEWRRPLEPVGHGLHGVGEVPVRAHGLVSGERGKSIAIGVAQHVRERRFGRAVGDQEEHAHALCDVRAAR